MFFRGHKAQVGLEVTDQVVRATRIEKSGMHFICTGHISLAFEKSPIPALQTIRKTFIRGREKIILGMPYENTISKMIALEVSLNKKTLHRYFKKCAQQLFERLDEKIYFDYCLLEKDKNQTIWQMVASKKIDVDQQIIQVTDAGLPLHAIDVNYCALPRIFHYIHETASETVAIALINETITQFCVFDQRRLLYATSILSDPISAILRGLQFFQQSKNQHPLHAIYLASHLPCDILAQHISEKISIKTAPVRLKMSGGSTLNYQSLISIALAMWGFVP